MFNFKKQNRIRHEDLWLRHELDTEIAKKRIGDSVCYRLLDRVKYGFIKETEVDVTLSDEQFAYRYFKEDDREKVIFYNTTFEKPGTSTQGKVLRQTRLLLIEKGVIDLSKVTKRISWEQSMYERQKVLLKKINILKSIDK